MKTTLHNLALLCLLTLCTLFTGCSKDHPEWEDGDPALQHVYFYAFEKWGGIPSGNDVTYNVVQGQTLAIPTQFHSKYTRSYSADVYYYAIANPTAEVALVNGTDYVVVDQAGKTLTPAPNGAYTMTFANATGGVQNLYIKALNGKKGSIRVLTFDPTRKIDVTDVSTTSIIKTDEYEVRAISDNYYVTVFIN